MLAVFWFLILSIFCKVSVLGGKTYNEFYHSFKVLSSGKIHIPIQGKHELAELLGTFLCFFF